MENKKKATTALDKYHILRRKFKYFCKFIYVYAYYTLNFVGEKKAKELFETIKPINIQDQLIRIGDEFDGGYLIPNDIDEVDACLSPGVGGTITFDEYFANKGIPVFMCDASVDKLPVKNDKIKFDKKFLSDQTIGNKIHINEWIEQKTKSLNSSNNLIFEMDIEGAEYNCLNALSEENLKKMNIIVIEFHYLYKWLHKNNYQYYLNIFKKLTEFHDVVHIHPNVIGRYSKVSNIYTPNVIEITFYRKNSKITGSDKPLHLPHPLDAPNYPPYASTYLSKNPAIICNIRKDMIIPENWFNNKNI